jgi:hypothetical protein
MRFGNLHRAARHRSALAKKTVVAVLGMHRSGTSAVAGMLQEHGVELGPVSERNRFNPRGNREIPELNRLHDAVLERSGGSWSDPPALVRVRWRDLRRRNEIIGSIPGETIGVKDPRMLVVPELWSDLRLKAIGVIRNPVAVRESLERRAAERPKRHPQLSSEAWDELWVHYNRALLGELERRPFPVIDFDRHEDLDAQLRTALASHGLEPSDDSAFFDPSLLGEPSRDWRSRVPTEAVELWERLAAFAAPPRSEY